MAWFLWRLGGRPAVPPSAPSSADVPTDSPHRQAISWLAARKITTGKGDGTFRPTDGLNREQTAAFLHRYADRPGSADGAPSLRDVPDSPFATAISWLAGW